MNKETLEALKGSIEKWENITNGDGLDLDIRNCPLCILFFDHSCKGCPVERSSKDTACEDTPYVEWGKHHAVVHKNRKTLRVFKNCSTCKKLAKAELSFLKSLLPKATP